MKMDIVQPVSAAQIHERRLALLEMRINAPAVVGNQSSPSKDINKNNSILSPEEYQGVSEMKSNSERTSKPEKDCLHHIFNNSSGNNSNNKKDNNTTVTATTITTVPISTIVEANDENSHDNCMDYGNEMMTERSKSPAIPPIDDGSRKRTYDISSINENSNEGGSHLSDNGRQGKYSRASEDNNSMEPSTGQNQDNGSKGSGPRQITLKAYFTSQDLITSANLAPSPIPPNPSTVTVPTLSSSSTTSSSTSTTSSSSISTITIESSSPPGKEQISTNSTTKKEKSQSKSSTSIALKASNASSFVPVPSTSVSTALSNTNVQLLQSTVQELKRQLDQARASKDQADSKVSRLENEICGLHEAFKVTEERNGRLCKYLEQVYREMAIQEARRKRDKLALDCVRLGKIATIRGGPSFNTINEIWEEGYAVKELNKRYAEHLERREELEKRKKRLTQLKRQAKKNTSSNAAVTATAAVIGSSLFATTIGSIGSNLTSSSASSTSALSSSSSSLSVLASVDDEEGEFDLDLMAEAEAIKFHQDQLKKEEQGLAEERKLLDSEKAVHQKELKRCQSEERSRFYRELPCLNSRYLLVSMLGRGGFSEVWKALDLLELKEVAVKVHQLNPAWTEDRKSSYIKHVTREYTIHRDLKHPRVVQLFDVFEIDVNSFATVLEYCKGIDLDEKLKRQRTIPEKEARTIILQILSGLKYLNTPSTPLTIESSMISEDISGDPSPLLIPPSTGRRKAIIHFDLKPANILFDEMGDAKITDFGLSKIIDDVDDNTSMELTSQGAGTYWYLPPECFGKDGPPRISSKVDVWSLGVIFYQMLYGKRPFGEGKSQEKVLSEGIILNANRVEFPIDPKGSKVSEEAKDLIRACLTADQKLRPDVFTLCQHAFLRNSK